MPKWVSGVPTSLLAPQAKLVPSSTLRLRVEKVADGGLTVEVAGAPRMPPVEPKGVFSWTLLRRILPRDVRTG